VSKFFKRKLEQGEVGHVYWVDEAGVARDLGKVTVEDFKILARVCEQAAAQGLNKRRVTAVAVTRARSLAMKLWNGVR
jgi:hypothetical protein